MIRGPLVLCLAAVLSAGCASRGSVRALKSDLQDVHTELGALRQSQETLSRQLTEVATTAKATHAATEGLRAEVATANAGVAPLTTRVGATEEGLKQVRETVAALASAPPPPPPSPPEQQRESRARAAESAFAAGLASFHSREYGQAILHFLDVVTKHPSHELASAAQFWIGESYYLQHDYRQALVEFQAVFNWGPPNPKAPDALVKVGLCYSRLREGSRAQAAWQRVIREFPDSLAAGQARALLASARSSIRR